MSKKVLSLVLALCMVLTLLPTTAFAADTDLPKAGADGVITLSGNNTYSVKGMVTNPIKVESGKVTLQFSSGTISVDGSKTAIEVSTGAELTIQGTGIKITNTGTVTAPLVKNAGTITLGKFTQIISAGTTAAEVVACIDNSGTITVSGKSTKIYNCLADGDTASAGIAIKNNENATFTYSGGGTIKSAGYAMVNCGKADFTGGITVKGTILTEYTNTASTAPKTTMTNGTALTGPEDGNAIEVKVATEKASYATTELVEITGGTVSGTISVDATGVTAAKNLIKATAGQFSNGAEENIAQYNVGDLVVDDSGTLGKATINVIVGESTKRYATMEKAMAYASQQTGEVTIKLVDDVTCERSASLWNGAKATLDLNGNKLTLNNVSLVINGLDTVLTIVDGATTGGEITGGGKTNTKNLITVGGGATLNFESGKLTYSPKTASEEDFNALYAIMVVTDSTSQYQATLNVKGGTIETDCYSIAVSGRSVVNVTGGSVTSKNAAAISGNGRNSFQDGCKITISGGKVASTNSAAIYQPQEGEIIITGDAVIEGKIGVLNRAGTVTVEPGEGGKVPTIKSTAEADETVTLGDTAHPVPAAAYVDDYNAAYAGAETGTTITGGTFEAAENIDTVVYTEQGSKGTEEKPLKNEPSIEVSGGTFKSGEAADTNVNQYTAADIAINQNTGKTYTYDNKIIAFGYGATRQEAIESAKAAREGTEGEPAETLWAGLDWIDQTFYIVFKEPVPAHKSIDVTVSFTIDGKDYTYTATCNGGDAGTSRMFAWSFLNDNQNTVVAPNGDEVKIKGTPTGSFTLSADESIDLNGNDTVAVEAAEDIVLEALIAGETAEEKTEKNMTVSVKNSEVFGQYYEASFATENLEATQQSGNGNKTYYLGWAMSAPEGATKFDYRMAATAEALVGTEWKTSQDLETNITGNGDKDTGLAVYFDAANIADAKTWVQVRFTDDTHNYGTYIVHVVMDEVTFAPMVDETDLDKKVTAATLKDTTGVEGEVADDYTVTSTWNAEERLVEVVIDAKNVTLHANANNQLGYWVGFTVVAPDGAKYLVGDVQANRDDISYSSTPTEGDVQEGPISFYLNAGNDAFKTTGMYYELQWLDSNNIVLETITYHVTIAKDATVAEPTAPTLYGAITTENAGTDKNDFAGTEITPVLKSDSEHGYYYEVTLDPGKLYESTSSDASHTGDGNKYYTGFAILAPDGVDQDAGVIADNFAGLKLPSASALSENVVPNNDGKGEAFYFTVDQDANGNLKLNKEWAKLAWYTDDKVVATYTFHVVLGNVNLQVTGVDAEITAFGFTATDGDKVINDELVKAYGSEDAALSKDAGTNVVYAVIKADVTGMTEQEIKLFVTDSQSTDKLELANNFKFKGKEGEAVTHVGYLAFSFDNETQTADHSGGLYTANLQVKQDNGNFLTVTSKELAIYKITYKADGATAEGDPITVYVIAENLASALKTVPSGFTATEGNDVRVKTTETDTDNEYNYTVTVEGYTRTVSGGTSNPTYSVAVPANPNGTVTVSPRSATAGTTITVTVTPNEGYSVDTVTVTQNGTGTAVTVTENADGTYSFAMPAGGATVQVTFVEGEKAAPSAKFTDVVQDAWYVEAIDYVVEKGLMEGTGETTFAPTAQTNRAMLVTILYRLEGEPAVTKDIPFSDVASGEWYSDAINWAAANEIVDGYGDGTFRPTRDLTREEAATILYRYAAYKKYDVTTTSDLAGYTDAASVRSYANDSMSWAVGTGLIKGVTETTLVPSGGAIRAQIATILMRFCENVVK